MRRNLYIGGGAALGAAARYFMKSTPVFSYSGHFPLNTLFINIVGAFLLALILTITLDNRAADPDLRLGVTAGLLGGFTTFSTLCKETVALLQGGDMVSAAVYMTASAALGLGAAYAGVAAARKVAAVLGMKRETIPEDEGEAD